MFSLGVYNPAPKFESVLLLLLFVILVVPAFETLLFLLLALLIHPDWLFDPEADKSDCFRRLVLTLILGGVTFAAVHAHLGSLVTTLHAFFSGVIFFAVLLAHWGIGRRDRGIVMCWLVHAIHNAIIVSLALIPIYDK
jgi:Type II CAAX prenyl endopeptidase Rce1-like